MSLCQSGQLYKRHCEERSDAASKASRSNPGLPRFAHKDAMFADLGILAPAHRLAHSRGMDDPIAQLSFEDALKRLEAIVARLESGDASLQESIDLYAEGDRLKQQCEVRLAAATARIEQIRTDAAGNVAKVEPFLAG